MSEESAEKLCLEAVEESDGDGLVDRRDDGRDVLSQDQGRVTAVQVHAPLEASVI